MDFNEQCYLNNSYRIDFSSRVRDVESAGDGLFAVYLDSTHFYPESGGQPDDRGTLAGKPVIAVAESEKGVRHLVRGELRAGEEIEGCIDWARRFDHMQQHSGQHLLSRVFLDDYRLRTVSFHLGEEICTIDLEGTMPSEEELEAAEARADGLIFKDIPITCRVVGAEDLREMTSAADSRGDNSSRDATVSKVLRSRLPEGIERVRIVEIEGFDICTCCGTHVRSTGEIGVIKILRLERAKGNVRVEFICGGRAVKDYAAKHRLLGAVASGFSTEWREIPRIVEKLSVESRELRKKSEELGREVVGLRAAELSKPTGSAGGFDIIRKVFAEGDAASLRETAARMRQMERKIVLFGLSGRSPVLVFACSHDVPLDMGELMRTSAATIGGRGGGGRDLAQGGGGDGSRIAQALEEAERRIREMLDGNG